MVKYVFTTVQMTFSTTVNAALMPFQVVWTTCFAARMVEPMTWPMILKAAWTMRWTVLDCIAMSTSFMISGISSAMMAPNTFDFMAVLRPFWAVVTPWSPVFIRPISPPPVAAPRPAAVMERPLLATLRSAALASRCSVRIELADLSTSPLIRPTAEPACVAVRANRETLVSVWPTVLRRPRKPETDRLSACASDMGGLLLSREP
ncbi:hypothetical protein SANTM175S_10297 [Streptomyces antimycoticus]